MEGKITVNVWSKSKENQRWFEPAGTASYRESTVSRKCCLQECKSYGHRLRI